LSKLKDRVPDQIIRLAVVAAVLAAALLVVRAFVIPEELTDPELHKTKTIERETAKGILYAGRTACKDCHEDEFATVVGGHHRNLACEICHGPSAGHADDPMAEKPPAPRDRKFCPQCHAFDASRPTGFPQINPVVHNPGMPCIDCHLAHDPEPPEPPHECSACHAQIAKTKSVSPHSQLDCSTCHEAPPEHKVTPRKVQVSKPGQREFCGKCHASGSENKAAPKIDITTHWDKYLCWQCHYPHMPEVK